MFESNQDFWLVILGAGISLLSTIAWDAYKDCKAKKSARSEFIRLYRHFKKSADKMNLWVLTQRQTPLSEIKAHSAELSPLFSILERSVFTTEDETIEKLYMILRVKYALLQSSVSEGSYRTNLEEFQKQIESLRLHIGAQEIPPGKDE